MVGVAVKVAVAVGVRPSVGMVEVGIGRMAHAPSNKLNKMAHRFIILARTKAFH